MKNRAVSLLSIFFLLIATASFAAAGGPAAPALLSPAAGAGVTSPVTISWSAVTDPSGIAGYNWQVSTSSNFSTIAQQNSTNGQTQDTISGLSTGTYYWRVQAVNGQFVQGAWSSARSFNVTGIGPGQPAAPTLGPTKAYSTFHPRETMTFNWSAVSGAASYTLQYSTDSTFPPSTSGQFNNIPDATYTFAMANEGSYFARVIAVSSTGIASAPSNVINFTVFYNNPIGPAPSPLSPGNGVTLKLPITLGWTDVPNPQPSGYEVQIAKDSSFQTIEESDPQLNNPSRTILSLTSGTKYWRARSHQGDSSPTTAAVTAWSASGSFTVDPAPPSPVSLSLASSQFYSGNTTWVALQLSSAAPSAGAVINLTSSDPNAAPVPVSVNMPGNTAWTQFQLTAGQVVSTTPVTITATLNSGTASVQFNVLPPSLKSLSVGPSTMSGGATAGATLMLNGLAPANGAIVNVTSDNPAAFPPASVTVAAGSASASFGVPTSNVSANTLVHITASWNGISVSAPLTLTPQGQPASLTLSPATVTGNAGSTGIVRIASASSVDQTFQVTSSNTSVATTPTSVLIPAGATAGQFVINTFIPNTQTTATISVSGGGVTRSALLTVNPASTTTSSTGTSAILSVSASGRSGESVSSTPAGINVAVGSTQSASFSTGSSITLTVSNGRDAIWSGACSSGGNKAKTCTFTLNGNSSVSANVQ